MDIISPPRFGSRKRSWGDEQLDRPYKRATYGRTRERPQCVPLVQQVANIPLEINAQPEDVTMVGVNEFQTQNVSTFRTFMPVFEPQVQRDVELYSLNATVSHSVDLADTTPTPASSNTLPGSNPKKRFAIGPRNNCEKCLSGEPGHYGHWL